LYQLIWPTEAAPTTLSEQCGEQELDALMSQGAAVWCLGIAHTWL